KVPGWIRALAPKGSLEIHEKAWNAYPYCKTGTKLEYVGDRFSIEIITWHKPDMGTIENVSHRILNLYSINTTIENTLIQYNTQDYKEDEDPTKFKSVKTGRGPLSAGWQKALESDTNTPHMCAYKLVKAEFRMFPIQGKVESTIQK
ncbi:hypothetical protein NL108_002656, partial [Boleophthalmus pectinirostris]